jgi:hypothetical protein
VVLVRTPLAVVSQNTFSESSSAPQKLVCTLPDYSSLVAKCLLIDLSGIHRFVTQLLVNAAALLATNTAGCCAKTNFLEADFGAW